MARSQQAQTRRWLRRFHSSLAGMRAMQFHLPPVIAHQSVLPGRLRAVHRGPENSKIAQPMKTASLTRRCLVLCAAIGLIASAIPHAARAADAPRIDALHVAKVATAYLATHGRSAPHIVSVSLEADAFIGGKTSWIVRFSHPLLTDGNREVGMRVRLDGSVSYLTEDKTGPKKRNVPLKS